MEFTFDFDQNVVNVLDRTVKFVSDSKCDILNSYLSAAVTLQDVPKNQRKSYIVHAASQGFSTMTADSLGKRIKECLSILDKFGSRDLADDAINGYNEWRLENGGQYTYSSQFLQSWLVNGKVHGADTVGKRIHGVDTPSKAETTEEDVSATEADEAPVKGDVVAAIAAILQGVNELDDLTLIAHMVAARADQVANVKVDA